MGKIIVSENVTLDGVVEDPTGEEGFKHGGWWLQVCDKDRQEWAKVALGEALGASALLLGRRSDEYFGPRWLTRGGAFADRLNSLPKYVVSATLKEPKWSNATVLTGDVVTEVSKLKQQLDGEILVIGSVRLARTLLEHDLVDELRLMVYPVALGTGERLFGETSDSKPVRLVRAEPVGDNLAVLVYQLVRGA
jgi:dihydrofolate reductase